MSSSSIQVSWYHDSESVATNSRYIVMYREQRHRSPTYNRIGTSKRNITLRGLKSFTRYTLYVVAFTSEGNGVPSEEISLITKMEGNCSLLFSSFVCCYCCFSFAQVVFFHCNARQLYKGLVWADPTSFTSVEYTQIL